MEKGLNCRLLGNSARAFAVLWNEAGRNDNTTKGLAVWVRDGSRNDRKKEGRNDGENRTSEIASAMFRN